MKRQSDRRAWSKAWRALVESPKVPAVARKLRSRHPHNRFFHPGRPLPDVVNQGIGASQIAGMPVRTTSYTTKTRKASQSFLRSTDSVHQSNHKMALPREAREASKINELRNRLGKKWLRCLPRLFDPNGAKRTRAPTGHHKVCPARGRHCSRTAVGLARLRAL